MTVKELELLRQEAEDALKKNRKGYLGFEQRCKILEKFSAKQAAFVVLNTLAVNSKLWKKLCPDDDAFDVALRHAADYAAGAISHDELQKFESALRAESENRINGGMFREGYILLSLDALYNELLSGDFTPKEDELGEDSDPEMWSSLFIGALPFSGAEEEIDDANSRLNRKYWTHFLDCLTLTEKLDYRFPAPKKPEAPIPARQQVARYADDAAIMQEINKLLENFIGYKNAYGWKQFMADYDEAWGRSFYAWSEKGQLSSDGWCVLFGQNDVVCDAYANIRQMMYQICPEEGVWFHMHIEIVEDNTYTISFDYDARSKILDCIGDPEHFAEEFNKFPRSPKFTPAWLKRIVKRYAKKDKQN